MRSNVRPFPTRKPDSEWGPRLIASLAYLSLGYLLQTPSGMSLNILMLVAILYWAFVHQRRLNTPYLIRFHLLQAIILYLFLSLGFLILHVAIEFIFAALGLVGLSGLFTTFKILFDGYFYLVASGLILGSAIVLAIAALLGKTPSIPGVTKNVEYWV